jgi:hypothetical protein
MNTLKNVWAYLQGKKTYILTAIGALDLLAEALGFIDRQTSMTILSACGLGSVITMRMAIGVAKEK